MRSMTIKLTTIKKKIKNGKEKVRIERCSNQSATTVYTGKFE